MLARRRDPPMRFRGANSSLREDGGPRVSPGANGWHPSGVRGGSLVWCDLRF